MLLDTKYLPSDPISVWPAFQEQCLDDKQASGSSGSGMAPSGDAHRLSLQCRDGTTTSNITQTPNVASLIITKFDSRLRKPGVTFLTPSLPQVADRLPKSFPKALETPHSLPGASRMSNLTEAKAEPTLQNLSEKTEDAQNDSLNEAQPQRGSFWRTVQRFIWDDPDKPAYEKKFLLKLDFFLLTYTCLGYFCKNL